MLYILWIYVFILTQLVISFVLRKSPVTLLPLADVLCFDWSSIREGFLLFLSEIVIAAMNGVLPKAGRGNDQQC